MVPKCPDYAGSTVYLFAPLIGWLADVKFGRYKFIKFGSLYSFLISVWLFVLFTTIYVSTLSNSLLTIASVSVIGAICYSAAMLPFLADQINSATSDELSTVVQWYYWAKIFGFALSDIVFWGFGYNDNKVGAGVAFILALAVIVISDCLCQQLLDKTHKATNPIKHSYPERCSALEQPSRMDYGKEKFGNVKKVEDVRTVLCLLPLVICWSLFVSILVGIHTKMDRWNSHTDFRTINCWNSHTVSWNSWLFSLLLIPFYRLVLGRCIYNYSSSVLKFAGASLAVTKLFYLLYNDLHFSRTDFVDWYLRLLTM